ncbi:MAG TPA: molybdate ABC transporter substrate-binding protein [Thermoanaerobaculia bacterium]|nr:molybdate ABC transporter substrate-binding protein [Thermoanaerobaculia bacterium]
MRPRLPLSLLSVSLLIGLSASPAEGAEVRVSAAASLTDALKELGPRFERESGHRVVCHFAATGLLARQLEEGAPADLFFSADEATMDRLEKGGLVAAGSRRSLLGNQLVIVVPAASTRTLSSPEDLAASDLRVLALADPRTVPAGTYARDYLVGRGLWQRLAARVVPTENVRAALAAVAAGNADAGIVYASDARDSDRVRVAWRVPVAEGPRISYPVALLGAAREPEAARALLAFLARPESLEAFRRHGFLPLSP